ncbi:MAG: phosphohistidine phosphatase SixA [Methanoregula sp.]|nr:phosphohistidine phosphatase SixA [Methanoregula sp.]
MDVFILRHGKAEDAGPGMSDADRQLTKKGRDEIVAVAHWIAFQKLHFDLIAASPLARAQETAALVAEVLGAQEKMLTWKTLVPGGNPDTVCREIGMHPKDSIILLVGHEPLLSSLISRIISGDTHAGIAMTKGALAKIRNYSFTQHPSGELQWLITAKQMAGTR